MSFQLLSKFTVKQVGGAVGTTSGVNSFLTIFLLSILFLFIKVFLVHWSYNEIIPNLFPQRYRKITMIEAAFLVILFQALFN